MSSLLHALTLIVSMLPLTLLAQSSPVEEDIDIYFEYPEREFIFLASEEGSEASDILSRMRATPAAYIAEIDSRIVFPDNLSLLDYPDIIYDNNWMGHLELLGHFGLMNVGASEDVVAVLLRINSEVTEDIDLLEDEIVNNPPPDLTGLQIALNAAASVYRRTLRTVHAMNEPALVLDALQHYDAQGFSNNVTIEDYISAVAGAFPPLETLEVSGEWELIGLPVAPFENSFEAIFSNSLPEQAPYWWDGQTYVLKESLEMGEGYWFKATQAGPEEIYGIKKPTITLDLVDGWNMIAGPSCDLAVAAIADPAGIAYLDNVFGEIDANYVLSTTIEQGKGYWLETQVAGQITLDCESESAGKIGNQIAFLPSERGFKTLQIQNSAGVSQSLYFGNRLPDNTSTSFSLPPKSPYGNFDVRFSGNSALLEGVQGVIEISSDQYPITLELIAGELDYFIVFDEMVEDEVVSSQRISAGQTVTVTNESVSSLRIREQ